jgi:hypothetical protein
VAATALFVLWTLFVWAVRVRNALTDDTLSTGAQVGAIALSASFLLPAFLILLWCLRNIRRGGKPGGGVALLRLLTFWTIGVWIFRGYAIVVNDHSTNFRVVHLTLGAVSIVLGVFASFRVLRPKRAQS